MRLSDWFWGSIPETFWTITDDGQRIVSDAGLHDFFDKFGNYSIVEENDPSAADGAIIDNSEDEKPVDANEKDEQASEPEDNTPAPDKSDRTDEVVSKLGVLTTTMGKIADRLTKLVVAIDAKGNAEVDDDEVEIW